MACMYFTSTGFLTFSDGSPETKLSFDLLAPILSVIIPMFGLLGSFLLVCQGSSNKKLYLLFHVMSGCASSASMVGFHYLTDFGTFNYKAEYAVWSIVVAALIAFSFMTISLLNIFFWSKRMHLRAFRLLIAALFAIALCVPHFVASAGTDLVLKPPSTDTQGYVVVWKALIAFYVSHGVMQSSQAQMLTYHISCHC